MKSPAWLTLVMSLPTQNATARMRIWRALKGLGCAALRDGIYLLPYGVEAKRNLEKQLSEIQSAGGSGHVVVMNAINEEQAKTFRNLFDRTAQYTSSMQAASELQSSLRDLDETQARRAMNRLRRELLEITAIDFFPGPAKEHATAALLQLETKIERLHSPGEPHAIAGRMKRRDTLEYQGRVWATREHPWVDRLASAWLIKRFIDKKARFLWLKKPKDCPRSAVGFDFDGAEFSHVGAKVTFEALLASFSLEDDAALSRLGSVVHYLDVGGVPAPEAAGLEIVLRGARATFQRDDDLLKHALKIFDFYYKAF